MSLGRVVTNCIVYAVANVAISLRKGELDRSTLR